MISFLHTFFLNHRLLVARRILLYCIRIFKRAMKIENRKERERGKKTSDKAEASYR
jgi:hypothetical protein